MRDSILSAIPKLAEIKGKLHLKRSEKSGRRGHNYFKSVELSSASLEYSKDQRFRALERIGERSKKGLVSRIVSRAFRLPKRKTCAIPEEQKLVPTLSLCQLSKQTSKPCESATQTLQGIRSHSSFVQMKSANKAQNYSRAPRSENFSDSIFSTSMRPGGQSKSLMLQGNLTGTFKSRNILPASRDKTNSSLLFRCIQSTDLNPGKGSKKGIFAQLYAYLFLGRVQLRRLLLQLHQWVQKKRACQPKEHVQRSHAQPSFRHRESIESSVSKDTELSKLVSKKPISSMLNENQSNRLESISWPAILSSIALVVRRGMITRKLPCFQISSNDFEYSAVTEFKKSSLKQNFALDLTRVGKTYLSGSGVYYSRISPASPTTALILRSSFLDIRQQNEVKPYCMDTKNRLNIARLARSSNLYFAPKLDMEIRGGVILQNIDILWQRSTS